MLEFLRISFMLVRKIDLFLSEKKYKEMTGLNFLMIVSFIAGSLTYSITDSIPKIFLSFYIIVMGLIVFFGGIRAIFFKKYSLRELFKDFSFKSYIVCLVFMSFILLVATMCLSFSIFLVTGDMIFPKSREGINVIYYGILCIESVLWFSFHILFNKVPLQDIKVKIAQYSAMIATLLLGGELIYGEGFLKLPIAFIVLSYLWITYIVELRVREIEEIKRNKSYSA